MLIVVKMKSVEEEVEEEEVGQGDEVTPAICTLESGTGLFRGEEATCWKGESTVVNGGMAVKQSVVSSDYAKCWF